MKSAIKSTKVSKHICEHPLVSFRRKDALKRLEDQLKSKVKTEKKSLDSKIPLTDSDIKRIKSEIAVLKKRLESVS